MNIELDIQRSPKGKSSIVSLLADGKIIHSDTFDLAKATQREKFIAAVQKKCPAIEATELEDSLFQKLQQQHSAQNAPTETTEVELPWVIGARELENTPKQLIEEAQARLKSPDLIQRILNGIELSGVAGETKLAMMVYLTGVSRLLAAPLAMIVQGSSSSGKSHVTDKVASLFPKEGVIVATQISPQALYYVAQGTLRHRFVVAGERSRLEGDEAAEKTRTLREMISARKVSKLVTTTNGGVPETKHFEQEGPIAYIETTTVEKIMEEDANRCIIFNSDDSQEQNRRVIHKESLKYQDGGFDQTEKLINLHHTMQRLLQPVEVTIPYSVAVGRLYPCEHTENRRSFGLLMNTIKAITLLHQFQRVRDENNRLIATEVDYRIAYFLLEEAFAKQVHSNAFWAAMKTFDRLAEVFINQQFTLLGVTEKLKLPRSTAGNHLKRLTDLGFLTKAGVARGNSPDLWQINSQPTESTNYLPTPEMIFGNNPERQRCTPQTITPEGVTASTA